MKNKLTFLNEYLSKAGLSDEACRLNHIIKICSILGIDYPAEETEVEGVDNVLKYLREKENHGKFIFLDNPKNSYKRFGQKNYRKMPFHYGEFVEISNPADEMGWDVIIVPSSSDVAKTEQSEEDDEETAYVPAGHNLIPVGYVPVNESQKEWTRRTKSKKRPQGKPAPVGNDKIILAPNGIIEDEDKKDIEEFFRPMWNFKDVVWL
ncbi:hypothetical protein CMI47_09690 [Candidatus Pacearchaeota archaeon]|nr:hypothetical protein [Candidatus Pacearchaeota archaeon]